MLGRTFAWIMLALAALAAAPVFAETRVALVIGNAGYRHAPALTNPGSDAEAMSAALRKVGFKTVEVRRDQGKAQFEAALKSFAQSARGADVAVIYYAGHSLEQAGVNYLVPVDASLATDADIEYESVPLKLLERSVEGASRLKLIILDACRNNPFAASMKRTSATRAIGRGMARVEPQGDTLIAYAAREGAVASDGDHGHSPYTRALVERLATPGLEIRLLFGQVRDDVLRATGRAQEPAIYGSLGGEPFYFVPGPGQPTLAAARVDPAAMELVFWQSVSDGTDAAGLNAYLAKYPDGAFAGLAKAKLAAFSAPAAVQPASLQWRGAPTGDAPVLGVLPRSLDAAARAELRLPADIKGVLVGAVPPQSEAAAKGLRAGDVITDVGGQPVATPGELRAAATRAMISGRSTVVVGFFRDGAAAQVSLSIARRPLSAGLSPQPGAPIAQAGGPRSQPMAPRPQAGGPRPQIGGTRPQAGGAPPLGRRLRP